MQLRNLLIKVEKYEDITADQTNIYKIFRILLQIHKSTLQKLDEKGVFQSDDEVGYFFEQMQNVQKELDRYMLPENYGKKESKS